MLVQSAGRFGRRTSEEHLRQNGREQRRTAHPGRIPERVFAGRGTVQNAGTLKPSDRKVFRCLTDDSGRIYLRSLGKNHIPVFPQN